MRFLSLCWVFITVVFVLLEICLRLNNNRLLTKSNKIKGRLSQKWSNLDLLNDDRNMSQDELKKIYGDLDKDSRPLLSKTSLKPNEFQRLQNFVILSLYVLQPPRRLQDYTEMRIKGTDDTGNYISKSKFIFRKYKTAKAHGQEEITINPKLKFILDKWKKLNPHEWLLVGMTDKKFSSSQLQQRLNSILGKKASVNILRHSFLSDKYKDINIRDMEETAEAMGHSKEQAMLYVKK